MTDQRPTGVVGDELALQLRIDGPLLDRKLTALRAMATQTTDQLAAVGLSTYTAQIAEESFVDAEHSALRQRSGHRPETVEAPASRLAACVSSHAGR